jgi:sulfur carrier protein
MPAKGKSGLLFLPVYGASNRFLMWCKRSVMIEVFINQKNYSIPEAGTLADVLPLLEIRQADGIAIALNEVVIPKGEWGEHVLGPGDRVFVIRATQGG